MRYHISTTSPAMATYYGHANNTQWSTKPDTELYGAAAHVRFAPSVEEYMEKGHFWRDFKALWNQEDVAAISADNISQDMSWPASYAFIASWVSSAKDIYYNSFTLPGAKAEMVEVAHNIALEEEYVSTHIESALINAMRQHNYIETENLLQKDGLNLDEEIAEGQTALSIAVSLEDETLVALLIKAGANPSVQTKNHGNTALHVAAKKGQQNIARLLIDQEPKTLYLKNKEGRAPLHLSLIHI